MGSFIGKKNPASSSLYRSPAKSNLLHFRAGQEKFVRQTFPGLYCLPDRPSRSLMERTSAVGSFIGKKKPRIIVHILFSNEI